MKFNFKKITSVLASVVMLGSTIGIAAAANYPAPFTTGMTGIVVGADALNSDYLAAVSIGTNLQAAIPTAGTSTTTATASGENVEVVGPGSDYLNLGQSLNEILTVDIDDDSPGEGLPTLLADGTYRNGENTDYSYTQAISLKGGNLTFFADSDYKDKEPTIGIKLIKKDNILNYTLDFTKDALSDVTSSDDLDDFESTDITILGKEYRIVDAGNDTAGTYLTILGGSITGVLALNEEATQTLNGRDYAIKLVYVSTTETQLEINGERTNKLTKGAIYKLSDGTSIGIKDISYQDYAGGVQTAEYTLGASKLKIQSGQSLEVNDEDEDSIKCDITGSDTAGKFTMSSIVLDWSADDEYFITPNTELTMPGLGEVKIAMGDLHTPTEEEVEVSYAGTDTVEMVVPIKDGKATIAFLYGNGVNWTQVGKGATERLATSLIELNQTARATDNITYNITTDAYMVVTYNTTTSAESYLVSVKNTQSDGVNYTTFKNEVTGQTICDKVQTGKTCSIGNSPLLVEQNWDDEEYAQISSSTTGVRFDRIYTEEGLEIHLPWINDSLASGPEICTQISGQDEIFAARNTSGAGIEIQCYNNDVFDLFMSEEDKDGNLGLGREFNITLGWTSTKATVNGLSEVEDLIGGQDYESQTDDDVYIGHMQSNLGSETVFDTAGTQDSIKVIYYGGETYGQVFVMTASGSITTGTTEIGSVTKYDNEIDQVKADNLIVVGGSCINTVAAKVLGVSAGTCGSAFTAATGVGADQFLIKVVNSPYTTGKIAMLVAGYEAADTTKAATYVTTEKPATAVGTTLKKTTATYADVA